MSVVPRGEEERCYWDLGAQVIIVRELLFRHPANKVDSVE